MKMISSVLQLTLKLFAFVKHSCSHPAYCLERTPISRLSSSVKTFKYITNFVYRIWHKSIRKAIIID